MEYLVTMTTRVPDGTPDEDVAGVRAREAAHSAGLAARGSLLRLWRPPLRPGEWRTLGLFAAGGDDELEEVLRSMPLRVWRTDQVTPLRPHSNDPVPPPAPGPPEFFTYFTLVIPDGTPAAESDERVAGEARRARELAAEGHLLRLWRLPRGAAGSPGGPGALGLWRARDAAEMAGIIESLPLGSWLTTDVTPLTPHPSDPVAGGDRG
jgi:muconolactone delta-isomerase